MPFINETKNHRAIDYERGFELTLVYENRGDFFTFLLRKESDEIKFHAKKKVVINVEDGHTINWTLFFLDKKTFGDLDEENTKEVILEAITEHGLHFTRKNIAHVTAEFQPV